MMSFGMMDILIGVIGLLIVVYYYLTANYNFWKKKRIPGPKPVLGFGTMQDVFFDKLSVGCYLKKLYEQYREEPMIGIYSWRNPVLILNDMELIKTILTRDFSSFSDRGMGIYEPHEPLSPHLFNLESERWRLLRPRLSPAYTSGKLREMFYLLRQCADELDHYLKEVDGKSIDIRDIAAKFTTDVIGLCAFGVEPSALKEENSIFRQMGRRIFNFTIKNLLRFRFRTFIPPLYYLFGRWLVDWELQKFFINLCRDSVDYRTKNNIVRQDFLDQLRELKEVSSKINDLELTDTLMAAQLFLFFVAGFETTSSTISNCLLELAKNHEIRDKLRKEILEELAETNEEITYEGIQRMEYLDKVMKETLRMYPPVMMIMRQSTAPYTFPNTKLSIPLGTRVWIPIFGIQRDSRYYPEPELFDPERFTKKAMKNRPQMSFLTFGDGPRNCIGARFGIMQTKVGLVKFLQKFTVDVCDKTDEEYKIDPRGFFMTPQNGIFVKIMSV